MPQVLIDLLSKEKKTKHGLTISRAVYMAAEESKIPVEYVASIIQQESAGQPWATRYEPAFFERRLKNRAREDLAGFVPRYIPTLNTEKVLRASSFGLMQVMGETARVVGYCSPYLTQLCEIEDNLAVGCKYLKQLLVKAATLAGTEGLQTDERTIWTQVLTWYNGSSEYPKLIFSIKEKELYKKILDGTATQ